MDVAVKKKNQNLKKIDMQVLKIIFCLLHGGTIPPIY